MTWRLSTLKLLSLLLVTMLLVAGCMGDDDDNGDDVTSVPTAGGTGPTTSTGESNMVEVRLTEYGIEMPATLPAGPTTFVVTNSGAEVHNFEVEGEGIEEEFEENLQPGETEELEIDLQAGTYEVYCPVGGHADLGMELELTVQ